MFALTCSRYCRKGSYQGSHTSYYLITWLHWLKQCEITEKKTPFKKKKKKIVSSCKSLCKSIVVFKMFLQYCANIQWISDTWQIHFTSIYIDSFLVQLPVCSQGSARFSHWRTKYREPKKGLSQTFLLFSRVLSLPSLRYKVHLNCRQPSLKKALLFT